MLKFKDNSHFKEIIKAGFMGIISAAAVLAAFAAVLLKLNMSQNNYIVALVLAAVVSGIVSGFASARKKRENGIANGFMSACMPCAVLVAAMSAAYKGFSAFELVPAAMCIFSGVCGGVAAVNMKRKKKRNINRRK